MSQPPADCRSESKQYAEVANDLLAAMFAKRPPAGTVNVALARLLNRILRSVETLTFIFSNNPNDADMDGALIVRTVYDAHLQVLYILQDAEPRASLYVDFLWVELKRQHELVGTLPNDAFKLLENHPKRKEAEAETARQFEAVKHKYLTANRTLRKHWYNGTLADLAVAVDSEAEYRALMVSLNPVVHSSAYGLQGPHVFAGAMLCHAAWTLLFRCLGRTAEYLKVEVSREIHDNILAIAYGHLFDADPDTLELLRQEMLDDDQDE